MNGIKHLMQREISQMQKIAESVEMAQKTMRRRNGSMRNQRRMPRRLYSTVKDSAFAVAPRTGDADMVSCLYCYELFVGHSKQTVCSSCQKQLVEALGEEEALILRMVERGMV
jgi:hypothetical protein